MLGRVLLLLAPSVIVRGQLDLSEIVNNDLVRIGRFGQKNLQGTLNNLDL